MNKVAASQTFTDEDLRLLSLCNAVAGWGYWRHSKLFYALKDAVLNAHGERDSYDIQTWEEEDWHEPREVHAEHCQILERWLLRGQVFHRPAGEFHYFNFAYQTARHSERYFELSKLCKEKLKGRKLHKSEMSYTDFRRMARTVGWPALKFLVGRFGHLIREAEAATVKGERRQQLERRAS